MKLFLFIALVPLFIGCSSPESSADTKPDDSKKAITTNTFPFGQNLDLFSEEPLRLTGGGDCWSFTRQFVSDTMGIVTDSTDCGENGTFQSYYFLQNRKLKLVHDQAAEVRFSEDGKKVSYILSETVYDFSVTPALESKRTDTLSTLNFDKLKTAFVVSELNNSKSKLAELTQKLTNKLTEPQNFENAEFTLVSTPAKVDKSTGVPSTEISLTSPLFKEPIFIIKESNLSEISDYQKREKAGIPGYAAFAFSSWYAGGGALYYGIVEGKFLNVYRKYQDEQEIPGTNKFRMIQEIDLENSGEKTDHYICFKEDNGKSPNIMIAFAKNGKAMYAKYEKQSSKINIEFLREEQKNDGVYPTTISHYKEVVNGQRTGKYTVTHSGNWDYLEYRRAKDGKTFKFTIDPSSSIDENGYRKTPCF